MSKARRYIAHKLLDASLPIVTIDHITLTIGSMYELGNRKGLFLRGQEPNVRDVKRYTRQLLANKDIYLTARKGVYRVAGQEPLSTQEMISLADPFIYVAYLSAMQRWGITNRNSKKFIFARPNKNIIKALKQTTFHDHEVDSYYDEAPIQLATSHHSLSRILDRRGSKNIQIVETNTPAQTMWLGGEHTRISTQASTFVDMLYRAELCGGMAHVIEVWETHIIERRALVLNKLIDIIDLASSPILKVRAGYLLSEHMNIQNDKVTSWKKFASRGGSRKLDPDKPYINRFSKDWMISLNA